MKKTLVVTTLAGALLATGGASARADLSLGGAMGLPLNPTAELPADNSVAVEGTYYDLGSLSLFGAKVSSEKYYGIQVAGRVTEKLEISAGVNRLHASDPTNLGLDGLNRTSPSIGAKYLIAGGDDPEAVKVAIGAQYNRALLKNLNIYAVASKNFQLGKCNPTVHIGVRHDHYSVEDIGGPKSNKVSVYGGVEIPLLKSFTLTGEVQSKNNDLGREKAPYSVGVRYNSGDRFTAAAGYERLGIFDGGGLYAKVGYSFDMTKR